MRSDRHVLPAFFPRRAFLRATAASGLAWTLSTRAADDHAGRRALMQQAERALAAGAPAAAAAFFEQAARLDDTDADAELGQLRAYLQQGDYARAVAWGRLVAGEHDSALARAWADGVEALARPAAAGVTAAAAAATAGGAPLPWPAARRPRAAPLRADFVSLARGLVDAPAGRVRLAPASLKAMRALPGDAPLWLADGLGNVFELEHDGRFAPAADSAEPAASLRAPAPVAARAVAGRPVLVLEAASPASPAATCGSDWPRLRSGLLAWPAAGATAMRIDLAGPAPVDGAPVFDGCGGWLGWVDGGTLAPALEGAQAGGASACAAGPAADVPGVYARWFASVGTVWRLA